MDTDTFCDKGILIAVCRHPEKAGNWRRSNGDVSSGAGLKFSLMTRIGRRWQIGIDAVPVMPRQ